MAIKISDARAGPAVRHEDGFAVIRIPMPDVQGLRVALADCPCRASKSTVTQGIRQRLSKALGRLQSQSSTRGRS